MPLTDSSRASRIVEEKRRRRKARRQRLKAKQKSTGNTVREKELVKATAYFGASLDPADFNDETTRSKTFQLGIDVLNQFPSVRILTQLTHACAVAISGPKEDLERLKTKLRELERGDVAIEDPSRPFVKSPVTIQDTPAPDLS